MHSELLNIIYSFYFNFFFGRPGVDMNVSFTDGCYSLANFFSSDYRGGLSLWDYLYDYGSGGEFTGYLVSFIATMLTIIFLYILLFKLFKWIFNLVFRLFKV